MSSLPILLSKIKLHRLSELGVTCWVCCVCVWGVSSLVLFINIVRRWSTQRWRRPLEGHPQLRRVNFLRPVQEFLWRQLEWRAGFQIPVDRESVPKFLRSRGFVLVPSHNILRKFWFALPRWYWGREDFIHSPGPKFQTLFQSDFPPLPRCCEQQEKQGRCNEGFNAGPIAFAF